MSIRREFSNNNNKRKSKRNTMPVNFNYDNPPSYTHDCYPNILPAISDPSLCYPWNYPFEPLSLPLYPPFSYRNCTAPHNIPVKSTDDFTSLPCVNNDSDDSDTKRRFSDPCIPKNEHQQNDIIRNLCDQVNYLKECNKSLSRELNEVRGEVSFLKQKFGMRFYDKEYEPGMLSDIVREIRDAARVREEALLNKVKNMIEERNITMSHLQIVSEKTRNSDRLGKLEDQMKNLYINNRDDGSLDNTATSTDQVLELEQRTLVLRRELQEAIAGKKDADARIFQLDQMLTSLKQKYTNNGDILMLPASSDSELKTNGNTTDNCSVMTTKSSSPSGRIVMSGPVTSL